jgi:hypothetical protein
LLPATMVFLRHYFSLLSLLLSLELHFLPPFSMVILYEYGRNRSLPHTLRSVPTQ